MTDIEIACIRQEFQDRRDAATEKYELDTLQQNLLERADIAVIKTKYDIARERIHDNYMEAMNKINSEEIEALG